MNDRLSCVCPEAPHRVQAVERSEAETELELAALSKALGHPARVRILRLLAARQACICGEIVGELDLAQSTVSQHLKIMKEAGIIQGEVDGPRVCYCLNPRVLQRFKVLVAAL